MSKDTSMKVHQASKDLGIREEALVDRAIIVYLDSISKYLALKQEMKAWDSLSDEALMSFEKGL